MEIDLVFKIAAIGIIVAVLNQLLIRSGREDQAMMTTLLLSSPCLICDRAGGGAGCCGSGRGAVCSAAEDLARVCTFSIAGCRNGGDLPWFVRF